MERVLIDCNTFLISTFFSTDGITWLPKVSSSIFALTPILLSYGFVSVKFFFSRIAFFTSFIGMLSISCRHAMSFLRKITSLNLHQQHLRSNFCFPFRKFQVDSCSQKNSLPHFNLSNRTATSNKTAPSRLTISLVPQPAILSIIPLLKYFFSNFSNTTSLVFCLFH